MENAVDAGAKHIDVLVVDAGRTSIQVIDDGKGMSETDARLAFERHATSKIRKRSLTIPTTFVIFAIPRMAKNSSL